ncbi:accessory Sec system protein Asp1 [Streptococcus suis]|uniref:accessory Sec system protein Asp1 n=1 Tax=Streptococcus suis TaxID=1307 RepID=UPI000CF5846E|nr:accessory Sec system protein Asp1 [Streptococcus suis]MCL4935647.1 accessory Sec system protein Asp1 [Streptococcus suis]
MLYYFIPSWYPEQRTWYDNTTNWYSMWSSARFDDTINQLRMFEGAGETNRLVILNYMPNLRYYKHRYDLFEVDTWSLFDRLQGIGEFQGAVVDYLDFDWPKGIEFVNSPFMALALLDGNLYAQIEFGESGQLIWIDFFETDQLSKKMVFDDRGFVSSILYFQAGQPVYQDYLGLDGRWRIREFLGEDDQHVEINPNLKAGLTNKTVYENMEELVQEQLTAYLNSSSEQAVIFLTASFQHHDLVMKAKGEQKILLSFFGQRCPLAQTERLKNMLVGVDLVITDSKKTADYLASFQLVPVHHLSLFDTRLALGQSQRLKELNVYFLLDGLSRDEYQACLQVIFNRMEVYKDLHLHLVSYQTDGDAIHQLTQDLEGFLETRTEAYLFFEKEEEPLFEFGDTESQKSRIQLSFFHTENEIIRTFQHTRLIIDLAEEPNLYTQIAGISSGIPQINRVETEFVEHMKNGYILFKNGGLLAGIDFYLAGLTNWNRSLIHSIQKISDYTSGVLVEKVKEKIN